MIFALLCFGIVIGTFGLCYYGILGLILEDGPFVNKKIQPGKHYRATQPLNLTTVPDKTDIFCVDFFDWNLTILIKKMTFYFLFLLNKFQNIKKDFISNFF